MKAPETTHQPPAITLTTVTKRYPGEKKEAIKQVSLEIAEGEWVGLMGANGSGKSTLLKLIMGFLRPDSGTIRVQGNANLEEARQAIGYVPENPDGLDHLTPRELIRFSYDMYNLPRSQRDQRVQEQLDQVGMWEHRHELIAGFSRGMRQRVLIASALIHQPAILLLDEPLQGLDAEARDFLITFLKRRPARSLILATHRLEVIQQVCNVGVILHRGEVKARLPLTPESLEYYEVESNDAVRNFFDRLPIAVQEWKASGTNRVRFRFHGNAETLQKVLTVLKQHHLPLHQVTSGNRLEELYLQYVKQ